MSRDLTKDSRKRCLAKPGNGHKKFLGPRVPDLESRRREALRRGRNPVQRVWVILQRIAPLLVIVGVSSVQTSSSLTPSPRRAALFESSAKAWPSRGDGRKAPQTSPCIP